MHQRESLVAKSSIKDTDYYNTIKDRYDELKDKLGNYNSLTDKVKSLQEDLNEAKEAKDKDEIKRLKAEIKETKKERKQYKLTNKEKNALKTTENQQKVLDSIGDTMVSIGATTTAAYQDLVKKIGNLEAKGEDNLTKKQQKNLQMFRDELTALNSGILASQVTDYIKVFEKWWKLDQKKVRTKQENLDYVALTEQKNAMKEAYEVSMQDLNDQLEDIKNSKTDVSDKIDEVTRSQTKETEETEKSFDTQINDLINSFSTNNAYAKWLKTQQENLASIQTQEQKKAKAEEDIANADQKITENQDIIKEADAIINDSKKTAAEKKAAKKQKSAAQKALKAAQETKKTAEKNKTAADKKLKTLEAQKKVYEDELKALETGADSVNYAEYLEAYRYVRDAKAYFADTGKYKDKAKFDVYQNKLDAWNNAKNLQITTLQKAREDALEQIAKKYEQQLKDLNAELNSIDSNGWEILRKTFELQIDYYEQDAALAEALVAHYKTIADILSNTDLDTLKNFDVNSILGIEPDNPKYKEKSFIWELLGLDDKKSAEDIISDAYYNAITKAKEKLANSSILYDAYAELINAAESGNFTNVITDEFKSKITDETSLANLEKMLEKAGTADWEGNEWVTDWQERQSQLVANLQSDINTIQELKDALRENVYFKAINNAIEQLESFKSKYQAFANIIDNEWVRDENGITEFGYAKVQALTSELDAARQEMNLYAEAVQKVDEAWADENSRYANEDEYLKDRNEKLANYYNSLQNAYSIEQSIYEIGKQALEEEVNEIKKAVDAYKVATNSKREYWEYSKNIQNQTKEIEALQAQIDALNGVSDAASKAKKKQLEEQLATAKENLENTQMDHLFKLESDALDKFIEDLEETLNDANKTVYHTFEEFANTVQSLIDEAALKDTSESLQKIVNLIAGNGTALVDGLETAITNTSVQATVTSDKENGNLVDISNVAENTRFIELLQSTNNIVSTMNDDIRGKLSALYEKATSIDNNISTIANNNNFEVSVTNNYDSLLNVEGSVDAKVLSNLKEILEESYKYTSEKLIKDLNSLGFYRNQR